MKVKGIKIRIGNLIYFNEVDSRGVGTLYKFIKKYNPLIFEKYFDSYDMNLHQVEVAENVPIMKIFQQNYFPETLFYNENIMIELRALNLSKLAAQDFRVFLKIDYENAFTVR